jgi:hypothetical protein
MQAIVVFSPRTQDGIARRKLEPLARRINVKKLIFASLLSVGAILAAQTPAAQAPAATSKTTVKTTAKKHHGKKSVKTTTSTVNK